jgi:hypothetical protein
VISPRRVLIGLLLLVVSISGCQPTPDTARLTDPTEILSEAVRRLAATSTVHLRLQMDMEAGAMAPGLDQTVFEADVDLERRDAAVQADLGVMGMSSTMRFILVGQDAFIQMDQTGRWMHMPLGVADDPRSGIPPNAAIVSALLPVLSGPGVASELVGMEDCGGRSCYHVRTTVSGDLLEEALGGGAAGVPDDIDDFVVEPPPVGDVTLDIHVDEASRQALSVLGSMRMADIQTKFSITLSQHGAGVRILAPPPHLVDRMGP